MHDSMTQLGEKLESWLKEKNIAFGSVKLYNSPRRLAVLVENVAEKQDDVKEEAKGPAKKIALDENGEWTKAAIGFSRGKEQVRKICILKTSKERNMYLCKNSKKARIRFHCFLSSAIW